MLYHLTPISSNKKTGPIPVTTTSRESCPPSCPFIGAGCYADLGPLGLHWSAVTDGTRGMSLDALTQAVRKLPRGQLWRHNQAGDIPGKGGRIAPAALAALVRANRGRRGFTYTHKPATPANLHAIRAANTGGFTINLSANNPGHADRLSEHGLPVVTVLPIDAPNKSTTPAGRKIVACPAEKSARVNCANCGLCQVRDRGYIIGFRAHGTRKAAADMIARRAS